MSAPVPIAASAASDTLIASLLENFPQAVGKITPRASADHPAINVSAADAVAVLTHLRDAHGYDVLADLTAVDWGAGATSASASSPARPRFTVVWHLLAATGGTTPVGSYLRVAADCASDTDPEMPSVAAIWPGADWHERETFDMFGIVFKGHPDLRRILMWDGYPHFPLRKEFPLAGIEGELPDPEVAAETGTHLIAAPMAGGPFVASSGGEMNLTEAEPSAKDESWNERVAKPKAEGPKN